MLAQPPALQPPTSADTRPFGLGDARIGMDLTAFRTRPGIACRPGQKPAVTVCRGPDLPLGGGYFARELDYRFVGGRLARIRFRSSVDAFSWVTARLKKDDGQPTRIVRDELSHRGRRLPHVTMTWTNGRSTIALSDPVQGMMQLGVSITRDGAQLAQDQS
jgi:hypothetical protein